MTVDGTSESLILGHSKGHQNSSQKESNAGAGARRDYSDEFKTEDVQILPGGHIAPSEVGRGSRDLECLFILDVVFCSANLVSFAVPQTTRAVIRSS